MLGLTSGFSDARVRLRQLGLRLRRSLLFELGDEKLVLDNYQGFRLFHLLSRVVVSVIRKAAHHGWRTNVLLKGFLVVLFLVSRLQ